MNTLTETDTLLQCSCGAKATTKKDFNRFRKRHPKLCSDRREYNKQLAQTTRSVITVNPEGTNKLAYWIEQIVTYGRGLTDWENNFVESVAEQLDQSGTLSVKQQEILERIYANHT